jgi:hypothetical protein
MEHWWNDTERGKPTYGEKTCPNATLPTINPTLTFPVLNPGLNGEKPVCKCLNYDTAILNYLIKK